MKNYLVTLAILTMSSVSFASVDRINAIKSRLAEIKEARKAMTVESKALRAELKQFNSAYKSEATALRAKYGKQTKRKKSQ